MIDVRTIQATIAVQVTPARYRAWADGVRGEGRTPTAAQQTAIRDACLLARLLSSPAHPDEEMPRVVAATGAR